MRTTGEGFWEVVAWTRATVAVSGLREAAGWTQTTVEDSGVPDDSGVLCDPADEERVRIRGYEDLGLTELVQTAAPWLHSGHEEAWRRTGDQFARSDG